MNDILIAQQNDTFISNAKEYLQTGKAHFDVSKLGSLKRHRKQLYLNEHSVFCWKNHVVLPKCFHSAVLELCHDHPTSEHFGEAHGIASLQITFGQLLKLTSLTGLRVAMFVINSILLQRAMQNNLSNSSLLTTDSN